MPLKVDCDGVSHGTNFIIMSVLLVRGGKADDPVGPVILVSFLISYYSSVIDGITLPGEYGDIRKRILVTN